VLRASLHAALLLLPTWLLYNTDEHLTSLLHVMGVMRHRSSSGLWLRASARGRNCSSKQQEQELQVNDKQRMHDAHNKAAV
jgi:hypothetical protein